VSKVFSDPAQVRMQRRLIAQELPSFAGFRILAAVPDLPVFARLLVCLRSQALQISDEELSLRNYSVYFFWVG
jgi:hypothetical protein